MILKYWNKIIHLNIFILPNSNNCIRCQVVTVSEKVLAIQFSSHMNCEELWWLMLKDMWWLCVTKLQTYMLTVWTTVYHQAELTFSAIQPADDTVCHLFPLSLFILIHLSYAPYSSLLVSWHGTTTLTATVKSSL